MAKRKTSRVNPKHKTRYRVVNCITVWFSEEAAALWKPPSEGQRGGQRKYSDLAIKTALTLRLIFSLGLRQTEGFVASLLELMDLDLKAPDHTTLSRRGKKVPLPKLASNSRMILCRTQSMWPIAPHAFVPEELMYWWR